MQPPVVIGAMGGSGTRAVARVVRQAGIFIGTNLNLSEDAMEFVEFYDRWINRYVLRRQAPFCQEEDALMTADFSACVDRHRREISSPETSWGWKEPRSLYLLPFFHTHFPKMRFIHVIRDGRDMAFSSNQNQLRKHGSAVLGRDLRDTPQPVRTTALWARINLETADYGETRLAERYLQIRFEDLCRSPRETVQTVLDFLGSGVDATEVAEVIVPPTSINRWQMITDEPLIRAIHLNAEAALRRFGYG